MHGAVHARHELTAVARVGDATTARSPTARLQAHSHLERSSRGFDLISETAADISKSTLESLRQEYRVYDGRVEFDTRALG